MMPMPTAQQVSATVGLPANGIGPTLSEKVPNPVQLSSPTKMSEPTPAARSPGVSTTPKSGPPIPAASISKKAPARGEPNSVETAAKLPAVPMTTRAVAGASFFTRCTARTPRPLPMAMSGASGPSTAPRHRVAREARTMPGRSTGSTGPVDLNPSAGSWPAVPWRCSIVRARPRGPEHERQDRPPGRRRVPAQVVRQADEDVLLGHVDELQQEVGDGCDRDADQRSEHQQHDVAACPKQRDRIARPGATDDELSEDVTSPPRPGGQASERTTRPRC